MKGPKEDRPIKPIDSDDIPNSEEPGSKMKVNFWRVRYKKFGPYDPIPKEYIEELIPAPTAEDIIAIMELRKLKHKRSSGCNGTFEVEDVEYVGAREMEMI